MADETTKDEVEETPAEVNEEAQAPESAIEAEAQPQAEADETGASAESEPEAEVEQAESSEEMAAEPVAEAVSAQQVANDDAVDAETDSTDAEDAAVAEATESESDDAPAEDAPSDNAPAAEEVIPSIAIGDLKTSMELRGRVKSIELYGAFVDIGVGKDALLHISQLGESNVRNVEDVVKKGEVITVYVLKVDPESERVALSFEQPPENPMNQLEVGQIVSGEIVRMENFGVFLDFGAERPGMIHVSELATGFIKSPEDVVKMGDTVQAQIIKVNRKKRQIDLSIKAIEEAEAREAVAEVNAVDEEDVPTAMELALRRAMQDSDADSTTTRNANKSKRNSQKKKQALQDALSRTLKQHDD